MTDKEQKMDGENSPPIFAHCHFRMFLYIEG